MNQIETTDPKILDLARGVIADTPIGWLEKPQVAYLFRRTLGGFCLPLPLDHIDLAAAELAFLFTESLADDDVYEWEDLQATMEAKHTRGNPLTERLLKRLLYQYFRETLGLPLPPPP